MHENNTSIKSGYLNEDFQLFHLNDKINQEFEFHYHEFNKIIIFIKGNVTYLIEGKAYNLKPWDILFVNNHDIHKPLIDPSKTYERIIIWANSNFIESHNYDSCDLTSCFKLASERSFNLVRLDTELRDKLKALIFNLEESLNTNNFGSKLLSNSLFLQLMIYLNRIHINNKYIEDKSSLKYDKQIVEIIKYINSNLSNDLSIEHISKKFFISKYHLMHKFKRETGYTLHKYIRQKRLFKAKELIENGVPIIKASMQSGFNDYSSFLRSFKELFNSSPKNFI